MHYNSYLGLFLSHPCYGVVPYNTNNRSTGSFIYLPREAAVYCISPAKESR